MKNFITIRLGNFAPHIRDIAYILSVHSASFLGSDYSLPQGRCADFDDQYVKRVTGQNVHWTRGP